MDGTEANGTSRKRDPKRKAEINHSSLQIIKKQTRPAGLAEIGARRACNGRQETLHPDLALKSFKVVSLTTCAQEPEGSETGTQRIENMDTCRKNKTYLLCICQNNKHSLKKKMGKKKTLSGTFTIETPKRHLGRSTVCQAMPWSGSVCS